MARFARAEGGGWSARAILAILAVLIAAALFIYVLLESPADAYRFNAGGGLALVAAYVLDHWDL